MPVSRVENATAMALGTFVLAAVSMTQVTMVTRAPTRPPTHTLRAGLSDCILAMIILLS